MFPLKAKSKQPATRRGLNEATTDTDTVRAWWEKWPTANVGVVTGPSGLVVVDMDDLEAAFVLGKRGLALPPTLAASTSKGYHFYYLAPEGVELKPTVGRLPGAGDTPGMDLRAGPSYVLAPPSIHPGGSRYQWVTTWATVPQPAPDWLRPEPPKERVVVKAANPTAYAKGALNKTVDRIKAAENGQRNHTLNREVFGLRRFVEAGELDREEVRKSCTEAARAIGLPTDEAGKTIASALGEL